MEGHGVHGSCDGRKTINDFMYRNYYYTLCIGKYSFFVMESLRLKTLRVESALGLALLVHERAVSDQIDMTFTKVDYSVFIQLFQHLIS